MAVIELEQTALVYGLSINKNNGIYNHGVEFDIEKKLRVEVSYQRCREAKIQPNLTHIACNCKVHVSTVTLPECMPSVTYCNLNTVLAMWSGREFTAPPLPRLTMLVVVGGASITMTEGGITMGYDCDDR
jgi:hypothetical protein